MVGSTGRRLLTQFFAAARGRAGSVLPVLAVILPLLAGIIGLSVDAGLWYDSKRVVQTSADAAAIAGAFVVASGNTGNLGAAALQDAERNGFVSAAPSAYAFNNPPTSGVYAGDPRAVEAVLTEHHSLLLASLFMSGDVAISARSVAQVRTTGTACVLALDPTAASAVNVSGSTTVDMTHCAVAANSTSSSAINLGGSSTLTAETLWTAGNYALGNSVDLDLAQPPAVNAWPLDDPFAGTTIPALGGCDETNLSIINETRTLTPGVYCNGLNLGSGSVVTLEPGVYYINRGNLTVAAQATLTCNCSAAGDGVTIVLTSSGTAAQIGTVTINGGANVTLNAPSDPSAEYTGLLFFQDPRATTSQTNKFNGGATMNLTGGIYFPAGHVDWSGNNSSGTPTCTQIVAKTVTFIGNSYMDNSGCPDAGVNAVQILGVALVE